MFTWAACALHRLQPVQTVSNLGLHSFLPSPRKRYTTLAGILSGEAQSASGTITRKVGYMPHDPRTGDLDVPANN